VFGDALHQLASMANGQKTWYAKPPPPSTSGINCFTFAKPLGPLVAGRYDLKLRLTACTGR
jgi:hypothetical protein